ncbi:MAG: glycerate kinase [Deltaproteobacteria bacterium]|nr:glycerate kinase [Deltaproteobacteria bacterium]MBW2136663.1 glycerate kinase [Deltaproteobacteria bacterium]
MHLVHEDLKAMRDDARQLFRAALRSVDPYAAVRNFVVLEGEKILLGPAKGQKMKLDLGRFERVLIVGGGKATAPMAKALEDLVGERIGKGLINVKYGFTESLKYVETTEAGHPLPDQSGVEGTRKILELLAEAGKKDLIISLISGGGSALLPQPADKISLEEKQALTKRLLECGASIDEINTIRKHISSSKGGQMARFAYPATTVNLMLSDVVGDKMDVIASGPFVFDRSTFQDALAVVGKYDLKDIPDSITSYLERGSEGRVPETPKEGDPIFEKVHNYVVGSNMQALKAAEAEARKMGYKTLILSSMVEGETRDVAKMHTAIVKEVLKTGNPLSPPACIISGGETTVTIRGKGLGGRNQEFCLSAAIDLAGIAPRVVILSGGTDGNDGPTPAAGAIVDPLTVRRGAEKGITALEYLMNNDSYHYFEKTGELLITGPTNTNVMDVRILLIR